MSQMTKREYCLKEIVDTERNYIGVLHMIVEVGRGEVEWNGWLGEGLSEVG